jgi:hypothetical protein
MIPMIKSICGLVGFDVTKMPWQDMIQDNEFSPFRILAWGSKRGECGLSMVVTWL